VHSLAGFWGSLDGSGDILPRRGHVVKAGVQIHLHKVRLDAFPDGVGFSTRTDTGIACLRIAPGKVGQRAMPRAADVGCALAAGAVCGAVEVVGSPLAVAGFRQAELAQVGERVADVGHSGSLLSGEWKNPPRGRWVRVSMDFHYL